MSYILEALKKAEAERRDGPSQTVRPPVFSARPAGRAWRAPWTWTALSAMVAISGIAAWYLTLPDAAPPVKMAEAPALPAFQLPAPEVEVPAAPEEPAAPPPKPKPKIAKKPVEKTPPENATVKKAAPPEPPLATLRELPEQIQREIPPLSVGGYIYSGNKADRSVLINKRLLREGDEVAPGLTLEKMQPNGIVLNYKGYRYRAGY